MAYTVAQFAANAQNKDGGLRSWQARKDDKTTVEADAFFDDLIDFDTASSGSGTGNGESDGTGETSLSEFFLAKYDGLPGSTAEDLFDYHDTLSQSNQDPNIKIEDGMNFGPGLSADENRPSQQQQQHRTVEFPDTSTAVTDVPGHVHGLSISDAELLKLEGISLQSPGRGMHTSSNPPSPAPPMTSMRKPMFLEAVSSTIRRAASIRSRSKQPSETRDGSPVRDPLPQENPFASPKNHFPPGTSKNTAPMPIAATSNGASRVSGYVEDPFCEPSTVPMPSPRTRLPKNCNGGDENSEARRTAMQRSVSMVGPTKSAWPQAATDSNMSWSQPAFPSPFGSFDGFQQQNWWGADPLQSLSNTGADSDPTRNASLDLARHTSQGDLGYEYNNGANDPMENLMIHMPQPRQVQPAVVHDLTLSAAAYLPPGPPQHQSQQPHSSPHSHQHDRSRPPRARSSSTRHMASMPSLSSPMRKTRTRTRSESTSPSPARGRHSSGESVFGRAVSGSSTGLSGGASVRKRRSSKLREPRTPGVGGIGFVNFTPDDSQMLMTGVAPSGSSKTKAKREREAMERRRKLSQAALKAVEAAGGDIGQLAEAAGDFIVY